MNGTNYIPAPELKPDDRAFVMACRNSLANSEVVRDLSLVTVVSDELRYIHLVRVQEEILGEKSKLDEIDLHIKVLEERITNIKRAVALYFASLGGNASQIQDNVPNEEIPPLIAEYEHAFNTLPPDKNVSGDLISGYCTLLQDAGSAIEQIKRHRSIVAEKLKKLKNEQKQLFLYYNVLATFLNCPADRCPTTERLLEQREHVQPNDTTIDQGHLPLWVSSRIADMLGNVLRRRQHAAAEFNRSAAPTTVSPLVRETLGGHVSNYVRRFLASVRKVLGGNR